MLKGFISIKISDFYLWCNLVLSFIFACVAVAVLWFYMDCHDISMFLPGAQYKKSIFNALHSYSLINITPLLIAMFYFFYKNQQLLSDSYVLKLPIGLEETFWTFVFIISNVLSLLSSIEKHSDFGFFNLFFSIGYCCFFVKYVFQHMHINKLFDEFYEEFELNCTMFANKRYFRIKRIFPSEEQIIQEISWNLDVLYQLAFFSVRHNINTVSIKREKYMEDVVSKFTGQLLLRILEKDDIGIYVKVYRELLKNQKKYVIELYEAYENSSCELAIVNLLKAYPYKCGEIGTDLSRKILDEYFKALWSLSMFFSERDRNKFQDVLSDLSMKSNDITSKENLIVVYRALIVNAIYKGDLNWLTEVCYIQKRAVDSWRMTTEENNVICKLQTNNPKFQYDGMMLFILLLAVIKATELSEYRQVGFLVKYIVSNYDAAQLCKVYLKLLENGCEDRAVKNIFFYRRLSIDFKLNEDICEYCLMKVTLLIYMQQIYRNIEMHIPLTIFSQAGKNSFNLEYCERKIYSVEKEYGMIAIEGYRKKKNTVVRWHDVNEQHTQN